MLQLWRTRPVPLPTTHVLLSRDAFELMRDNAAVGSETSTLCMQRAMGILSAIEERYISEAEQGLITSIELYMKGLLMVRQ